MTGLIAVRLFDVFGLWCRKERFGVVQVAMDTSISSPVRSPVANDGFCSNGLDVAAVHPSRGSKYSPNLHKWLTARGRRHRAWTSRVYRDADGALWIGTLDLGDLFGSRLMEVLCSGTKAQSCCWVGLVGLVEVSDFWLCYVRDGRCAIDAAHQQYFIGDESRWAVIGDTRSCLWCGKAQQVLSRWTDAVQRSEWINQVG